jgi:transcriptional regulator with XRE-family HTH domain
MAKQMNVEQAFRIKRLLAERRLSITSLALKLGEAYGSVANNIYGHRRNPDLQAKIATFLGRTPEELFGENGTVRVEESGPLAGEVSHV